MVLQMNRFRRPHPSGPRRRLVVGCLASSLAAFVSAAASADDQVFTPVGGGTSGDFNNSGNWFDANNAGNSNVPGTTDRADIASATDTTNGTTLTATFGADLSNPSATVNTLYLGANADGNAANEGTFTSSTYGNGVLTQVSGSLTVNTWTVIGERSQTTDTARFGTGTYNLQGGIFHQAGTDNVAVGQGGTGFFNVSGGATAQIDSTLNVGRWSQTDNHGQGAGNGTVTVGTQGATNDTTSLTVNADLNVGLEGTGTFTQYSGTVTNASTSATPTTANGSGWTYIGHNSGSTGTYNMVGGTLNTASRLMVGQAGNGTLTQTGGTVNVGTGTSGSVDLTLADAGGTGTYNLSGGTLSVLKPYGSGGGVFVGGWTGGSGTLNVSGTGVLNTVDMAVARNDPNGGTGATTGLVMQTGGTVNISASLVLGNDPSANNTDGHTTGTYTLQAGNLNLGTGGLTLGGGGTATRVGTGVFNLQGGTLDAQRSTLAFGANSPAASAFNFTAGTLQNAGAVNFFLNQPGGTFEAGTLAAPATTTVTGNGTNAYTLTSPGTLQVAILGTSSFDQVQAGSGIVTLTGGNLAVHVPTGVTIPTGAQFAVLTSGTTPIVGAFSQGATVTADNGQLFAITYNTFPTGGTAGDDVVLTALPVPEPAAVSALALLTAAGLLRRRRRRSL